jgi:dolichol-phosphate mannosyltransferase
MVWLDAVWMGLLVLQVPASAIWLARLMQGALRRPPLQPQSLQSNYLESVSAIVPTLNEVERLMPCLQGLDQQSAELHEVIVVDSRSTDGTPDLVAAQQRHDPRLRLMQDEMLPPGWVGRPWALQSGFLASSETTDWILGIDADTQPQPGLVSSLLQVATQEGFDLITLSPRFILKYPGELWLQPALLMTLIYRFGAVGDRYSTADRVMANGQCFFCKKSLLVSVGGYDAARGSFCDDVTLARVIAQTGAKVGFLDGANLLKVRMYEGFWETWREWGRSLDLKDATTRSQLWADLWLLTMVQGLPIVLLGILFGIMSQASLSAMTPIVSVLLLLNILLFAIRILLNVAIFASYDLSQASYQWLFWLSPLADPLATVRIWLSANQVPRSWRGREYGEFVQDKIAGSVPG